MFFLNSFSLFAMDNDGMGGDRLLSTVPKTFKTPDKQEKSRNSDKSKKQQRRRSVSFSDKVPHEIGTRQPTGASSSSSNGSGSPKTFPSSTISSSFDGTPRETPPNTPKKAGNDQEARYMEMAHYLLKSDKPLVEKAKVFVYSYLVFMEGKDFLAKLKDHKGKFSNEIQVFLERVVHEGFFENLKLAKDEFNELKEGLETSPMLNMNLLEQFVQTTSDPTKFQQMSKEEQNDKIKKVKAFADALLYRDLALFKKIPFSDFEKYFSSKGLGPDSIKNLSHHFNQTSRWVALQIISPSSQEEREKKLKEYCFIARHLLQTKNLHGAMQVATGIKSACVSRLISNEVAEKDENWIKITKFSSPLDHYKTYRDELNKAKEGILPAFSIITSDLTAAHELYGSEHSDTLLSVPEKLKKLEGEESLDLTKAWDEFLNARILPRRSAGLEKIAKTLEIFFRFRTVSFPNVVDPAYLKFVSDFDIHEEVLDVFSDLGKKWEKMEIPDPSQARALKDWTPLYFYSLLKKKKCSEQIRAIFEAQIWEGPHIISYMGQGTSEEKRVKLSQLGARQMNTDIPIDNKKKTKDRKESETSHPGINAAMIDAILKAEEYNPQ